MTEQVESDLEYTELESHVTTPTEKLYLALADEAIRQTIPRLNDALSRLVTLGTAMAGGSLVFLRDDVCTVWGRVLAAACFFLALATAIYGSIPRNPNVDRYEVPAIQGGFTRAVAVKKRWVWLASGLLLAGIFVAIVGASWRAMQERPSAESVLTK
jgi:hypothetical protein